MVKGWVLRTLAVVVVGAVTSLLSIRPAGASDPPAPNEYQVKAAFLFHFLQYVDWPADAGSGGLCVGLLGEDPFGSALTEVVRDEAIQGRKLIVRRAAQAEDLKGCALVFVPRTEKARTSKILAAFDQAPTLTVGETEGFTQQGGIVRFYLDGKKVRFEINPGAARAKGLRISSQLLALGKIVDTVEGSGRR
jgi:hypothetical protein